MSKNGYSSVMTCGACAVSMGESGEVITSIDHVVSGVKRLLGRREASAKGSTAAALR